MGLNRGKHLSRREADSETTRDPSAAEGEAVRDPSEAEERGPDEPTDIPARSWVTVLKRAAKEFKADALTDRAAALTYYGILAVFPALLVGVAMLGVLGPSATHTVLDNVQKLAPGSLRDLLHTAVTQAGSNRGTGGALAIVGLVGALWSASSYIAAFIRASNAVYDIPEGRPIWKTTPLRLGLTVLMMVLLLASGVIVVFTGPLAQHAGDVLGVGHSAVVAWSIAKWPVLVVLVAFMIAVLYWAAPNVRSRGFRWVSPGSALAVVLWLVLSGAFAAYVANFGSYNKTYGTVAGVIVSLVWLWLSNLAILLGLEFDAELAREQAIEGGMNPRQEPYVPPRDTAKWPADMTEPPSTRARRSRATRR